VTSAPRADEQIPIELEAAPTDVGAASVHDLGPKGASRASL
jgi:hypothetical protein